MQDIKCQKYIQTRARNRRINTKYFFIRVRAKHIPRKIYQKRENEEESFRDRVLMARKFSRYKVPLILFLFNFHANKSHAWKDKSFLFFFFLS